MAHEHDAALLDQGELGGCSEYDWPKRSRLTDAGMREVDLLPILRDELATHKAAARANAHDDLVFPTAAGTPRDKDNARERVIRPVVKRADELLAERSCAPLPAGVTAHKLRHTFASVLIALGRDPAYVMGQLGHADPAFTLRIYAHAMRRGDDERDALRMLVEGRDWGTRRHPGVQWTVEPSPQDAPSNEKAPR